MPRVPFFVPVVAALFMVALSSSSVGQAKVGKSLVVGGIMPCTGLPLNMVKNLPRDAAGTVVVLQGQVGRTRQGGVRLPTHVVARRTVGSNQTFRFAVFPGHYVLAARLAHYNATGFLRITVHEGVTVHVVIPNSCK